MHFLRVLFKKNNNPVFISVYLADDFSTITTSLMVIHMVLVAIIGTTANLCVFLALSMGHKVSNNLLLLNLCIADSMVCIISGPLTVLTWEWPVLSSYTIINAVQVRIRCTYLYIVENCVKAELKLICSNGLFYNVS